MLAFADWSSTGTHYQVRYFSDIALPELYCNCVTAISFKTYILWNAVWVFACQKRYISAVKAVQKPTPAKPGLHWANCPPPYGIPITAECDTAWIRTRDFNDASCTEMQFLRPLRSCVCVFVLTILTVLEWLKRCKHFKYWLSVLFLWAWKILDIGIGQKCYIGASLLYRNAVNDFQLRILVRYCIVSIP
jgi:hypothetical protein